MHVAIIMDGNGRWAAQRHLPRSAGHRAGAKAVDAIVTTAARRGIGTLTLYAFSAANWSRPKVEVSGLFTLLRRYLATQTHKCLEQSIRMNVIGRRDRLSDELRQLIERSERVTAHGTGMRLRIAIDYSAQHSILEACRRLQSASVIDRSRFIEQLAAAEHASEPAPEVDLVIRTGGEQRLSDFLLWECAYAEFHFVPALWPDFDAQSFEQALADYARRDRRFGGLSTAPEAVRSSLG
jgi:undecaprenyl diphosphate synthase